MRALWPAANGFVDHGGIRLGFEVFGSDLPTVVLMPTWTIIHARHWKMQVPHLARRYRVVSYDGPGNGNSDRPMTPDPYTTEAQVGHLLAVLDASETDSAVLVSFSKGANWALKMAADTPDRVCGLAFIAPGLLLAPHSPERQEALAQFSERVDRSDGWYKYNRHYWLEHYEDFARFFFGQMFSEPHSTKPIDDCVGWALETTPELLLVERVAVPDRDAVLAWCEAVSCPVLVVQGSEDAISPSERGRILAEACGGELMMMHGSGHAPHVRDPVRVNLALEAFVMSCMRGSGAHRRTGGAKA